ncbi:hypothetical protein F4680DRAFT_410462 [Xylaria scruposa]|nr:hypothetical protein F4680DRAFT_410462 [Xylaria scruposa]
MEDTSTFQEGREDLNTVRQQTRDDDPTDLKDSAKAPSLPQRRKTIQSSAVESALAQFLVFQFPALSFTTGLLILYLKCTSWNPTPDQLGALVVAAKIHETLIITSLFDMVMYHIRRGLLGRRGIPYGFLTAPFQLTSPLYLFTSEFWSCFRSTNMHSVLLALLLVVSIVLASLAGASSAFIIVPKLGWRALPTEEICKNCSEILRVIPGHAIPPSMPVFPSNINLSMVSEICLDASADTLGHNCPYDGLTDSSTALYANFESIGNWPGLYNTVNLTISNTDLRTITYYSRDENSQMVAATTPLICVENILSVDSYKWSALRKEPVKIVADLHDANGNAMVMKQPRVITQCSDGSGVQGQYTGSQYYHFRVLQLFYPEFNFTVPKFVFQDALESKTNLGFIDVKDYLPYSINTSVAIWTRETLDNNDIGICLIDARWVETDAWIFPLNAGSKIQHSVTINTNHTTYGNVSSFGDDLIHIDPAWGNLLNQTLDSGSLVPVSLNATSVFGLITQLRRDYSGTTSNALASKLTIVLTEALAMVPSRQAWFVQRHSKDRSWGPLETYNSSEQIEDYALLKPSRYENVYSYNFSEITTGLSWIVLFYHYLLVLVHLIVLCAHGGRTSKRWGRLGEIMCLALNSRSTSLLTNTSAGVKGSKIWGLNATVREVGAEGKVELVLRDGEDSSALHDYGMIQPDRRYG